MKASCAITVVVMWIYSVFLWARWRMAAQCREGKRARTLAQGRIKMYLKVSGLPVLGWLILIMG